MQHEAEYIQHMYFFRVLCPIKKKWYTTRWRMTEDDAAKTFADTQYEIQRSTLEIRHCGGDWTRNSTSHAAAPRSGSEAAREKYLKGK